MDEIKKINSYYIRLSGEVEIPEQISMRDYRIVIDGSIIAATLKDNSDGTFDREYKFRPLTGEILKENGQTVKTIDKRRNSVKLRNMIEMLRREKYPEEDEDKFYDEFCSYLRSSFEELARGFRK